MKTVQSRCSSATWMSTVIYNGITDDLSIGYAPRHTGGAVPLRFLVKTAITLVTPPVVFHSFPLPVTPGGAVPLRFLIKTPTNLVTPPVVFNSFPLPVTHLTAVEPPRDRRRGASLHFRDCMAAFAAEVLRWWRYYSGGTAVMEMLLRSLYGATAVMAVPRRPHCGLAQ